MIYDVASPEGGWSLTQLNLLGVKGQPVHGWIQSLVGREISVDDYAKVIALSGVKKKRDRVAVLNGQANLL